MDYAQFGDRGDRVGGGAGELQALSQGEQGLQPFHWQLEFPKFLTVPMQALSLCWQSTVCRCVTFTNANIDGYF